MGWKKFRSVIQNVAPVGKALTQGTPAAAVFGALEHVAKEKAPESVAEPVASSEIERIALFAPIIRQACLKAFGKAALDRMDAFADAWDYAAEHEEEGGSMTPRELTKRLLEEYEDRRHTPYICPAGYWTVGIGHNLEEVPIQGWTKSDPKNLRLNDQEIDALLDSDISSVERQTRLLRFPYAELPEAIREVVVRMCFQMGVGGVNGFPSMCKSLRQTPPDYLWMAREMRDSKWWRKDSPARAEAEVKRVEAFAQSLST